MSQGPHHEGKIKTAIRSKSKSKTNVKDNPLIEASVFSESLGGAAWNPAIKRAQEEVVS